MDVTFGIDGKDLRIHGASYGPSQWHDVTGTVRCSVKENKLSVPGGVYQIFGDGNKLKEEMTKEEKEKNEKKHAASAPRNAFTVFYSFVDGTTPAAYDVKMFTGLFQSYLLLLCGCSLMILNELFTISNLGGGRTDPNICVESKKCGEKVDAPTPTPHRSATVARTSEKASAVTLNGKNGLLDQCKKEAIDPVEVGLKKLEKDIDSFFNLGKKKKKKKKDKNS